MTFTGELWLNRMQKTIDTLLYLIRLSLGTDQPKPIGDNVDWNAVMELANKQGVGAIAFDAIEELNDTGLLDFQLFEGGKKLRVEWIGSVIIQEQIYKAHENVIAKLASFYSKHEIDMMILKGYGLSLNYPRPNHRPCGDIDIWLRGKQQEADLLLAKYWGIQPQKSSHHTIFEIDGCEVENHITILERDTHRSNIPIDEVLTKLANEKAEIVEIKGKRLLLPSAEFNSLFLLRHSAIHFFVEGIVIRHLLDWATFIVRYSEEIDWDSLYRYSTENNFDRFLSCINAICVDYLGFNPKQFPVKNKNEELEGRVIGDILNKEFDEKIPDRHKHFFKYCFVKTKRLWANRWKSQITNTDSFVSAFLGYAKNRIKEDL